jgi:hypothetical protein
MQDIQTFGAGISSFPPPLKEVIHTENKEDFFSMPPSPLQEKNIPKKSFFLHQISLFLSAIGIISITILFNFFSPFANRDEAFLNNFFSEYSKSPYTQETITIEKNQQNLLKEFISAKDEDSANKALIKLQESESRNFQKIKEASEKFPYEKFSSSEKVKIQAFFQVLLSHSKDSKSIFFEDLGTCFYKEIHHEMNTEIFCSQIAENLKKASIEMPSRLSIALGMNEEQSQEYKEQFLKAFSKNSQ